MPRHAMKDIELNRMNNSKTLSLDPNSYNVGDLIEVRYGEGKIMARTSKLFTKNSTYDSFADFVECRESYTIQKTAERGRYLTCTSIEGIKVFTSA